MNRSLPVVLGAVFLLGACDTPTEPDSAEPMFIEAAVSVASATTTVSWDLLEDRLGPTDPRWTQAQAWYSPSTSDGSSIVIRVECDRRVNGESVCDSGRPLKLAAAFFGDDGRYCAERTGFTYAEGRTLRLSLTAARSSGGELCDPYS